MTDDTYYYPTTGCELGYGWTDNTSTAATMPTYGTIWKQLGTTGYSSQSKYIDLLKYKLGSYRFGSSIKVEYEWDTTDTTTVGDGAYKSYAMKDQTDYSCTSIVVKHTTDVYGLHQAWNCGDQPRLTPSQRLVAMIRERQAPAVHARNRTCVPHPVDDREVRARETLQTIVGARAYQRFLAKGFVIARNPQSGYTYQIFHRSYHLVHVYQNHRLVERLCIHFPYGFTPTDFVVTAYLMAINNDNRLWEIANKHGKRSISPLPSPVVTEPKSLVELFQQLKATAA